MDYLPYAPGDFYGGGSTLNVLAAPVFVFMRFFHRGYPAVFHTFHRVIHI